MQKKSIFLGLFISLLFVLSSTNVFAQKRYSGSKHSSSHGGRYSGGRGSSHKGGNTDTLLNSIHKIKFLNIILT